MCTETGRTLFLKLSGNDKAQPQQPAVPGVFTVVAAVRGGEGGALAPWASAGGYACRTSRKPNQPKEVHYSFLNML